jgi:colicin import membrane protein
VERAIKKNWRFPVVGRDKNLVAVVEIRISKAGQILESRVAQSSGRPDFDNSALKAVTETKDLPPPPSDSLEALRINFNLQELR